MKRLLKYMFIGAIALQMSSCSNFLDTYPKDALTPSTTWKTPDDAEKFAIGCYNDWNDGAEILYWDCASDFGYNNFPWEGLKNIGNGSMTQSNPGWSLYHFKNIRRCNTFLNKIKNVTFGDESIKNDLIGQIKAMRAYQYFKMNWWYGGVPIIGNYTSAQEAKVPRSSEEEVRKYVEKELDEAIPMLKIKNARGRFTKGAAMALRMREALYYKDWAKAKEMAQKIIDLNIYSLDDNYARLFRVDGQNSKEIILALQYIPNTFALSTIGQMYNNGEGGWSSIVPTRQLVETYEMKNGKTITDPSSGYDPAHPFKGRDPRMAMTIRYPGEDYTKNGGVKAIFDPYSKEINGSNNPDYWNGENNASKTCLTWNKYLEPITQYSDMWATNACPIIFRYAEALLTWAEAENELNGPSPEVYAKINMIRRRAGMPNVDETKYGSKETLRELIHRERGVEFAGEGLRRADLLRWTTPGGKMLAEKVLNGVLTKYVGTVDKTIADPEMRATIDVNAPKDETKVETREFKPYNRYLPIPQSALDRNGKLKQNPGYQ